MNANTGLRYNREGMRVTDCCGAHSTYVEGSRLVCKSCFTEVPLGQGDGNSWIHIGDKERSGAHHPRPKCEFVSKKKAISVWMTEMRGLLHYELDELRKLTDEEGIATDKDFHKKLRVKFIEPDNMNGFEHDRIRLELPLPSTNENSNGSISQYVSYDYELIGDCVSVFDTGTKDNIVTFACGSPEENLTELMTGFLDVYIDTLNDLGLEDTV